MTPRGSSENPLCQGLLPKRMRGERTPGRTDRLKMFFFFRFGKRRFNVRGDARSEPLAKRPFLFVCVK